MSEGIGRAGRLTFFADGSWEALGGESDAPIKNPRPDGRIPCRVLTQVHEEAQVEAVCRWAFVGWDGFDGRTQAEYKSEVQALLSGTG